MENSEFIAIVISAIIMGLVLYFAIKSANKTAREEGFSQTQK